VRDELPFFRQENEQLGLLLDIRDDMLREAKKTRKELRASLEDARTRVAELETQNLDAKLEIDSPKSTGSGTSLSVDLLSQNPLLSRWHHSFPAMKLGRLVAMEVARSAIPVKIESGCA
jgi:hypothetical protein